MWTKNTLLWLVFAFTLLSGVHYIILTGQRMKTRARNGEA
jgi:hypothetical protein